MPVPLNAIAETILSIQEDSKLLEISIAEVETKLAKNNATIAELSPLAEWGPDPVEPEVLPAPVEEPPVG